MIFELSKSSDWSEEVKDIEINTIDDLEKLQEEYAIPKNSDNWKNPSLIIDFKSKTIEIYDNYRE